MAHKPTQRFWEDYRRLPDDIKKKARKAFRLFSQNPRHPSLETHYIRGTNNPKVYEGYIDRGYRFTFHYEEDAVVYRRIGPHSIVDEESRT